ncbi:hypothetical protein SDC9_95545 [bioreactor metagenome]|uniref:HTH cro/C1-type domain-containing protein n=1 Tax=bioreactor metagenome TaxID=1076179 RepID=A0A645A7Z3_9ZZZZ
MSEISFSKYLKELREEKNLTIAKLAEKSGVSHTYVSMLERGKRKPTTNIIEALSNALGDNEEEADLFKTNMEIFSNEDVLKILNDEVEERSNNIVNIIKSSNVISDLRAQLKNAEMTLNLNHALNYFTKKEEVRLVHEKRSAGDFVSPDEDLRGIAITLDGKDLTIEEVKALEYLVLGIQKRRNLK